MPVREINWHGSTLEDLSGMPKGVQRQFHTKLRFLAQDAPVSGIASWSGIGPAGKELRSGGYRMVLTTEFAGSVDVLHAFSKDSARGRRTRGKHVETVGHRYGQLTAAHGAREPRH
jgi:phage-related protein